MLYAEFAGCFIAGFVSCVLLLVIALEGHEKEQAQIRQDLGVPHTENRFLVRS